MDHLPDVVPPIPREVTLDRGLAPRQAIEWLHAGWHDFKSVNLEASMFYGVAVFLVSIVVTVGVFALGADYAFFPALGAFLVIGPALAVGLYEKSRRISAGEKVGIGDMLFVRSRSPGQILFIGVLLLLLVLLWVRVAVLLYALFFGMRAFPGMNEIVPILLTTPRGWGLLLSGSIFGALFAALGFAVSAVSIPMLLNERSDAFSAMGGSMALIWHNLPVMLTWGVIVLGIFVLCALSGFLGLVVAFPVLGHATWHAYVALRGEPGSPILRPAIASKGAADVQSIDTPDVPG